jgi:hypothetical protein
VPKASRLGVASFLIALGFPLLLLALFVVLVLLVADGSPLRYGQIDNQTGDELLISLVMLGALGGPLVHFVGLSVGIAGAFQKTRRRLFATLGTVLNGILLLLIWTLWIVFLGRLLKALAWH